MQNIEHRIRWSVAIHTKGVYTKIMNKQVQQRVNIVLPQETLDLLDAVSKKGERSRVIDIAVRDYVSRAGRMHVRKLLIEGSKVRNNRDLDIARQWGQLKDVNDVW